MGAGKFAKGSFWRHAFRLVFIESKPLLPSATKSLNRFKSSRAHHFFRPPHRQDRNGRVPPGAETAELEGWTVSRGNTMR